MYKNSPYGRKENGERKDFCENVCGERQKAGI